MNHPVIKSFLIITIFFLCTSWIYGQATVNSGPNRSKCLGDTVQIPIRITGQNVLNMALYITYDHTILTPYSTPYQNVNPSMAVTGFNPVYNATTMGLFIDAAGLTGINFSNDLLIRLVFTLAAPGTTQFAFNTASSPVSRIWDELGNRISPLTFSGNAVTSINATYPAAAGIITGVSTVSQGQTGVPFSVGTIANATGYVWTLPTGATIASGANSSSITVDFSATAASGIITVMGTNGCGNGISSPPFNVTVQQGVPPELTVQGQVVHPGETPCYNATGIITVAGNGTTYIVEDGGQAEFIAGLKIIFLPGAKVFSGGKMYAHITTQSQYCNTPPVPGAPIEVAGTNERPANGSGEFLVYPNPAQDFINIDRIGTQVIGAVEASLCNMYGKVLSRQTLQQSHQQYTLAGLPSGIYFLRLSWDGGQTVIKVIRK